MANAVVIPNLVVPGGQQSESLGLLGSDYITNTTNLDGAAANVVWGIITAITTATFTLLTSPSTSVNGAAPAAGNLNGLVLPEGRSIYGRFTNITLTSGSVIAYRTQTQ